MDLCAFEVLSNMSGFCILFHLPLLQMFPECGTEIFARRPSLAASYYVISQERKKAHHCKRFSLAGLNETFYCAIFLSLGKGLYEAIVSCYHSVVSN